MNRKPRPRKCANCKELFMPARMGQKCCCPMCALAFAQSERQRAERKAEIQRQSAERKQRREAKEKTKRLADYIREAQAAFNAWVRLRDALSASRAITASLPMRSIKPER